MLDGVTIRRLAEFQGLIRRCRTAYDILDCNLELPAVVRDGTVRHIGVHHNVFGIGGIGRVLPILIGKLLAAGYKVTVFIDHQVPQEKSLSALPEGVDLVVLPHAVSDSNKKALAKRIATLAEELRARQIDAWYEHSHNLIAWSDNSALWTLMAVRYVLGIPCYMHVHAQFTMDLYRGDGDWFDVLLRKFFPTWMSALVVLSKSNAWFFRSHGVRAVYMPNPLDDALKTASGRAAKSAEDGKTVLWVGRMVSVPKQPMEALRIFELVHEKVPTAKLVMLGDGDAMADALRYREKHGLTSCVELAGVRSDAYSFYQKADVFLCTSRFEGFPMVLLEAMAHSLPVVAYELSGVEPLRNNEGAMIVPQGDAAAAADAIVRLLSDGNLAARTAQASRENLRQYDEYDFSTAYRGLFGGEATDDGFGENEDEQLRDAVSAGLWDAANYSNQIFRNTLLQYGRMFRPLTRAVIAYHLSRAFLSAPFSRQSARLHKEKAVRLEKLYRWVAKPGRRVPLFG